MSKGKYVKKSSKKFPLWVFLLLLTAILAFFVPMLFTTPDLPSEDNGNKPVDQTEIPGPISTDAQGNTVYIENPEVTVPIDAPETEAGTEPQQTQTTDPAQTKPMETLPPQTMPQQTQADYENWLAAAMVVCVSMEYPDFQLEGIYATSVTSLEDKFSSDGVYIVFTSGGNRIAIHSAALDQERSTPGTKDISTETIGFASFDFVSPADLDLDILNNIPLDELSELISQSLLIRIYTH